MPTKEYYSRQAKILLDLAAATTDKAVANRLIARANEYQMLADTIRDDDPLPPAPAPGAVRQPMQQQQQQQQKSEDDKDE